MFCVGFISVLFVVIGFFIGCSGLFILMIIILFVVSFFRAYTYFSFFMVRFVNEIYCGFILYVFNCVLFKVVWILLVIIVCIILCFFV